MNIDRPSQSPRSHLFTVRVWQEETDPDQTEWRGKVQLLTSGDVRYFRHWAAHVTEPGVPTVNNVQVSGGSVEIGPFNTAGIYHIYCSVHQGMNLTIIVQ